MKLTLRELTHEDFDEFVKAYSANWEEDFIFAHYFEETAQKNFRKYLKILKDFQEGQGLPEGHVPSTLLFAFDEEGRMVGRSSIRHELNEQLLREAGHVGYGVVPSLRRQGHATEIFRLTLEYIRKNMTHIDRVLVTCDENNFGSQKTITKNNGVLENQIELISGKPKKNRYWVDLA